MKNWFNFWLGWWYMGRAMRKSPFILYSMTIYMRALNEAFNQQKTTADILPFKRKL